MSNDPTADEYEQVTDPEAEPEPQEPSPSTPPPRVGTVPDSVVFIQPPPVT